MCWGGHVGGWGAVLASGRCVCGMIFCGAVCWDLSRWHISACVYLVLFEVYRSFHSILNCQRYAELELLVLSQPKSISKQRAATSGNLEFADLIR